MKRFLLASALILAAGQSQAGGYGSAPSDGISATVGLASLSLMSSLESTNYYSQQAQDDAASFVATEGAVSGPALEKAVRDHREIHPESTLSDMDIANTMLIGSLN